MGSLQSKSSSGLVPLGGVGGASVDLSPLTGRVAAVETAVSSLGTKFRGDWATGELVWSDDFSGGFGDWWVRTGNTAISTSAPTGYTSSAQFGEKFGNGGTLTLDLSKISVLNKKTLTQVQFYHQVNRFTGNANTLSENGIQKWSRSTGADSLSPWENQTVNLGNTGNLTWADGGSGGWITAVRLYATVSPYMLGEFVLYNGKMWKSASNTNSTVPGVSPTWVEVPVNFNKTYTTAGRPSAVDAGEGAQIYDSDLDMPVFSNGAVWLPAVASSGSSGGSAIKDRRYTAGTGQVSIDEFNDGTLNSAWTRVDGTGTDTRVVWTESGDSLSLRHTGGDAGNYLHGMIRPLSGTGVGGAVAVGDTFVVGLTITGTGQYIMGGVILTDSATHGQGYQVLSMGYDAGGGLTVDTRVMQNWNAQVSETGDLGAPRMVPYHQRLVYYAANSWRTDISADGFTWITGPGLNFTFTATHVGVFTSTWGGGAAQGLVSYDYIRRESGVA